MLGLGLKQLVQTADPLAGLAGYMFDFRADKHVTDPDTAWQDANLTPADSGILTLSGSGASLVTGWNGSAPSLPAVSLGSGTLSLISDLVPASEQQFTIYIVGTGFQNNSLFAAAVELLDGSTNYYKILGGVTESTPFVETVGFKAYGDGADEINQWTPSGDITSPCIITAAVDRTIVYPTVADRARVNGVDVALGSSFGDGSGAPNFDLDLTTLTVKLGGQSVIAEVFCVNRLHTTDEIEFVEGVLMSRWTV